MRRTSINIYLQCVWSLALFFSGAVANSKVQDKNNIIIQGKFEGDYPDEDIQIFFYEDLLLPSTKYMQRARTVKCSVDSDGRFLCNLSNVTASMYFYLGQGTHNGKLIPILDLYTVSPNDSVYMYIRCRKDERFDKRFSDKGNPKYTYDIRFAGRGYEKMQCKFELDISKSIIMEDILKNKFAQNKDLNSLEITDVVLSRQLKYLDEHRDQIGQEAYNILKLEKLSLAMIDMDKKFRQNANDSNADTVYLNAVKLLKQIPVDITEKSPFVNLMLLKFHHNLTVSSEINGVERIFKSQVIKDRLYTAFLLENWKELTTGNISRYLSIREDIQSKYYREILDALFANRSLSMLNTLILTDKNGKNVSLSMLQGKVVFMDFYYTGCGNCVSYYKNVVSRAERYFTGNKDVVFVSVSIDGNLEKWVETLKVGLYSSSSAVNLYTGGLGANHPIIQALNIRKYPSPILFNREGEIVCSSYVELGQGNYMKLIDRINREL